MADTETAEHEQLVNDYVDLWHGEFSKRDVVAESVTLRDPGLPEGEIHGRDAVVAFLRDLRTGFPDFHVTIDDHLADEGTIMAEWTATGTHEGEFNGLAPTGREMELTGMDKILVADGRVQEHRIYYDVREMMAQLGHDDG
jgi:steroid delta-isomerase-like uncharacterized protein